MGVVYMQQQAGSETSRQNHSRMGMGIVIEGRGTDIEVGTTQGVGTISHTRTGSSMLR